jgi:hypothetical protein
VRVFNYNTLERVAAFEAHSDYVRCIAVHPAQPFILVRTRPLLCRIPLFSRGGGRFVARFFIREEQTPGVSFSYLFSAESLRHLRRHSLRIFHNQPLLLILTIRLQRCDGQ